MELHQLASDGETESGSVVSPGRRGVDLREFAKNEVVVILCYPAAGVADLNDQLVGVSAPSRETDPDAPSIGCELDRVSNQVSENVLQFVAVGKTGGRSSPLRRSIVSRFFAAKA